MNTIAVRNVEIGAGIPKICIPVAGADAREIAEQAERALREQPDLLEWRADYFAEVSDPAAVAAVLADLRGRAGDIPLLFTLRTAPEGGRIDPDPDAYAQIVLHALRHAETDLVDIEGLRAERRPEELIAEAFREGKATIASAHFFDRTPPEAEMRDLLARLADTGADIVKLAVMAGAQEDAFALMRATRDFTAAGRIPAITMAMGEAGIITRTTGRLTGSAVTFGTAGAATAPGQLPARELRELLHKI